MEKHGRVAADSPQHTANRATSFDLDASDAERDASSCGAESDGLMYSVSEAIDTIGFGRFQVAILFYAGLAWASDAMELMLVSFLAPAVSCQWGLSAHQEGAISTVVFAGTFIGANAWGALADTYGRRAGFFATALFSFAFGIGSALAPNYPALLVLRGMVGVGLGGAHVPVALYLEFVPTKLRGVMLVALQSFWTIGTMVEALLGWAVLSTMGWRWLLGISSIPLLGLLLLYPVLPESPYFLAAVGQTQQAQEVLATVARVNKKPMPPGSLKRTAAVRKPEGKTRWQQAAAVVKSVGTALSSVFTPGLAMTTSLLMFIWFSNALTYYGEVLLTTTIHTQKHKATCGPDHVLRLSSQDMSEVFITSMAELPGLLVAALLIDVLGRRRTMTLGMLTIAISTGSLIFSMAHSTVQLFASRAASMGAFTVLYIYTPEVYPTRVRSFALGLNNSMSRLGAIIAPFLSVDLGQGGHLQLAEGAITGCCLVAAICTCALPYETSGMNLQVDSETLKKSASGPEELAASANTPPDEEAGAGLLGERRADSHLQPPG